jgi:hypothetical protein
MMIAYNEKSLDALVINEEAVRALKKQLISKEEHAAIANAYRADLYSPNLFIRIGLFILTAVIASTTYGLSFVMFNTFGIVLNNDNIIFIITLIFGVSSYAVLELMVQHSRHYRSGVDDALLWTSLGFIVFGISIYSHLTPLSTSVLIFILSLAASIRFANSVMSAVMFGSFISIIFFSITPMGTIGKAILPFVVMVISICVYLLLLNNKHKTSLRHYKYCFIMLEVLSLVTIYVSGNYFVVRELSVLMFDLRLPADASITGGWFFWICTFFLPFLYIVRGLQAKDHVILRTGLLLIAATVFTFRYYYSVAPIEQVMVTGGIIMIIVAYAVMRYLQAPRYGITDKPLDIENIEGGLQVESLVVAETFNEVPSPDEGFRFGGGSTGGGGATGQF